MVISLGRPAPTVLPVAVAVGTALSLLLQGSDILAGDATVGTWVQVAVNYAVAFLAASIGGGDTPYQWLAEPLADSNGPVLDLACGSAPTQPLLAASRWLGTDLSAGELALARTAGRGPLVRARADHLPLADDPAEASVLIDSLYLPNIEPERVTAAERTLAAWARPRREPADMEPTMTNRRERKELLGIEQELEQSDPAFARAFRDCADTSAYRRWNRTGTRIALCAAGIALFIISAAVDMQWLFLLSMLLVATASGMRTRHSLFRH